MTLSNVYDVSARNPTKNLNVMILEGKKKIYFLDINIAYARRSVDTIINGHRNYNANTTFAMTCITCKSNCKNSYLLQYCRNT